MEEFLASLQSQGIYLFRMLLAGICGLALGYERTKRDKEAGIRTHFIVASGAALIMTISLQFSDSGDGARIAAQIVSGIGFLGAGMIFFRRESLHGLTTAAGIWCTAGIGMAMGVGGYLLAIGATLMIFLAQLLFHNHYFQKVRGHKLLLIKFYYSMEVKEALKNSFDIKEFSRLKFVKEGERIFAEAVVKPMKHCDADFLANIMKSNENIIAIERLEDL